MKYKYTIVKEFTNLGKEDKDNENIHYGNENIHYGSAMDTETHLKNTLISLEKQCSKIKPIRIETMRASVLPHPDCHEYLYGIIVPFSFKIVGDNIFSLRCILDRKLNDSEQLVFTTIGFEVVDSAEFIDIEQIEYKRVHIATTETHYLESSI